MITFTGEMGLTVGHVIACCFDAAAAAPRYGSYEDAVAALHTLNHLVEAGLVARTPLPGCSMPETCPDYDLHVHGIEDAERPEVQVTNRNAPLLLNALGYGEFNESDDMWGEASPEEFRARVLTALAVAPADAGAPAHLSTGVPGYLDNVLSGAQWHQCGRREGWLQDTLAALHELADWCTQYGRQVHWH